MKMYWITGILGFLLIVAPYVLNFADNTTVLATITLIGLGVIAASVFEATAHNKEQWEYWVAGIHGVAAFFAPFVLRFATLTTALWTSVIVGGLITIVAGLRLFTKMPQNKLLR